MRVLVTGATGFIGKHLCALLLSRGHEVHATFRKEAPDASPQIKWIKISDIVTVDWSAHLSGIDYVIHLAAFAHQFGKNVDISEFDRVNFQSVARLSEAVAGSPSIRRLLFISSIGAICTNSTKLVTGESVCNPDSAYGKSKRAAEISIHEILAHTSADWCILRPTLVYGPGNPGNMLRLARLLRTGLPLPLASVHNRRSFLYVGNLVDAIVRCLQHTAAGRRTFNISDGKAFSTPDLLRLLGEVSGQPVHLLPIPPEILKVLGKFGDFASRIFGRSMPVDSYSVERLLGSLEVEISSLQTSLNWQPPFSPEEGLRATFSAESIS